MVGHRISFSGNLQKLKFRAHFCVRSLYEIIHICTAVVDESEM